MSTLMKETPSLAYVAKMGMGWNLGNTFDSHKVDDEQEESWGNPRVTKKLVKTVKEKGYKNIRLPLTLHQRISGPEENYTIDQAFLDRYEEVVQWSLEEGLYVMLNVHHDSVTWLKEWDGDTTSPLYKKYVRIWEQLSDRFKDYDEKVYFESINEPQFHTTEEVGMSYLEILNDTFYHLVRESGGKNKTRMLVLPTLFTNDSQNKLDALYKQITDFKDENLIATVHYYSVWMYSANIGRTRFDEPLPDGSTPRTSLVAVFDRITETFIDRGIGVIIGEYGLLGYDKSDTANQFGETLKYLEFVNYYAKKKGLSLILWDNGQHLNRHAYEWYLPRFGDMIEQSLERRSAYSEGLDTLYLMEPVPKDGRRIPLTLNGQSLESVRAGDQLLKVGEDYSLDGTILHLTESYFATLYEETKGEIGVVTTLVLTFSEGSDWHQMLIYTAEPVLEESAGKQGETLVIPTTYKGNHVEKVLVRDTDGEAVANNKGLEYLQHSREFEPGDDKKSLHLLPDLTHMLNDGVYTLVISFYSGLSKGYQLVVEDGQIIGQPTNKSHEGEGSCYLN